MKLYSTVLGGIGILTKPCVSPQVFHGSMRLAGRGVVTTDVRGLKLEGYRRSTHKTAALAEAFPRFGMRWADLNEVVAFAG